MTQHEQYQICSNCIMDTTDPQITFNQEGVCDFCTSYYEVLKPSWMTNEKGKQQLKKLTKKIKAAGTGSGRKYDCLIGLSGGTDSSFLTYYATINMGLKPLIISVNTGWNMETADQNIKKLVSKLNLDYVVVNVNWEEMKDLQTAFFASGVAYQDLPQDHAIFAGVYNYAVEYGIKYVLTGGNHSTECVKPPQEWTYYNDMRFIKDVHHKFGKIPLKTFPMCGMFKYRIYYKYFKGMRVVRPLNFINYIKEDAVELLSKEIGWEKYDNKHYENRFTRFFEGWWQPKRFNIDKRKCYYSSLILTEQMTRDEALKEIKTNPYDETLAREDEAYICQKLGITQEQMNQFFTMPKKTFRDYKNNHWLIMLAIRLAVRVGMENRNFR